jgi:hypothetical protein
MPGRNIANGHFVLSIKDPVDAAEQQQRANDRYCYPEEHFDELLIW